MEIKWWLEKTWRNERQKIFLLAMSHVCGLGVRSNYQSCWLIPELILNARTSDLIILNLELHAPLTLMWVPLSFKAVCVSTLSRVWLSIGRDSNLFLRLYSIAVQEVYGSEGSYCSKCELDPVQTDVQQTMKRTRRGKRKSRQCSCFCDHAQLYGLLFQYHHSVWIIITEPGTVSVHPTSSLIWLTSIKKESLQCI